MASCFLVMEGLPFFFLGCMLVPGGLIVGFTAPELQHTSWGPLLGLGIGLGEGLWIGGTGLTCIIAGLGTLLGQRWAWGLAVAIFATQIPSCLLPIGVFGVVCLARADGRRSLGIA